jgi:hypothetical protein
VNRFAPAVEAPLKRKHSSSEDFSASAAANTLSGELNKVYSTFSPL